MAKRDGTININLSMVKQVEALAEATRIFRMLYANLPDDLKIRDMIKQWLDKYGQR